MAKIRKIKEKELIGGTSNTEVYPITHARAVYDKNNTPLSDTLEFLNTEIVWNNSGTLSNMNDFVVAGVYDIKGERTRINDNLPILNAGSGHSFNARLTVLDSSISGSGEDDDKCITQVLSFSNRLGQGEVYIRTGKGSSLDSLTWEKWSTLQRNVNIGSLNSKVDLRKYIDNGIYSGVFRYGSSIDDLRTFVMVVINDYAIGLSPRRVSQFLYSIDKATGKVSYETQTCEGETWKGWEILNKSEIDSMISNAIKAAIDDLVGTAPDTLDTLQEIAKWVSNHQDLYGTLKDLAEENTKKINDEITRATEAEQEIKDKAVKADCLNFQTRAKEVALDYKTIKGVGGEITIPSATAETAGVMSAEDKRKLEDTSNKTKNVYTTEADNTIEEIVICNNDETEEIVKINNEGLAAKKIFNLDGEELKPSGLHSIADDPATLEICDENQRPILTIDSKGNINTSSFNSLNVAKNKFKGKTMLYIGDSISTGNIWHWKGYIKDCIGLNYVNYNINDTVSVTPAVGGITIRPHNDDDTRPMNAGAAEVGSGAKSIWWRCCNKRLGIYDFDYINLFGGTNDIYDNNLNVGTIDDAPLLDTDVEDLTALDLSKVSFASAFMGCIEMLQRDFPGKPIFICTLLYNGYAKTPEVVKIQMLAAQKYGLKVVPFYYSELNSQNYQWLCDGFHPKQVAARIMEKNFIEYINL